MKILIINMGQGICGGDDEAYLLIGKRFGSLHFFDVFSLPVGEQLLKVVDLSLQLFPTSSQRFYLSLVTSCTDLWYMYIPSR